MPSLLSNNYFLKVRKNLICMFNKLYNREKLSPKNYLSIVTIRISHVIEGMLFPKMYKVKI